LLSGCRARNLVEIYITRALDNAAVLETRSKSYCISRCTRHILWSYILLYAVVCFRRIYRYRYFIVYRVFSIFRWWIKIIINVGKKKWFFNARRVPSMFPNELIMTVNYKSCVWTPNGLELGLWWLRAKIIKWIVWLVRWSWFSMSIYLIRRFYKIFVGMYIIGV